MTDPLILQHNLEFELRLQQYIEMVRSQDQSKKLEAILHARKYLTPNHESQNNEIMRAAGLLVFNQETRAEPYKVGIFIIQPHSIANFILVTVLTGTVEVSC